jgi:hypothetical protein
MLRQHHVRVQDLRNYMRGYDPAKPTAPDEWAKGESTIFEPGMILFCLDAVATPPGLSNFGKKEHESGETYRVTNLCIVIGKENNRPLVVNITASAYEQRFLEVLLLEKARKAILDGKDFVYVAAQPREALTDPSAKELEQLSALYANGGSRRSLVAEANGPIEPSVALLSVLGVRLAQQGNKQVLDIGSVCHLLFAPEGRQEDKNKALVRAAFMPITGSVGGATPEVAPDTQSAEMPVMPSTQPLLAEAAPPAPLPKPFMEPSFAAPASEFSQPEPIFPQANASFDQIQPSFQSPVPDLSPHFSAQTEPTFPQAEPSYPQTEPAFPQAEPSYPQIASFLEPPVESGFLASFERTEGLPSDPYGGNAFSPENFNTEPGHFSFAPGQPPSYEGGLANESFSQFGAPPQEAAPASPVPDSSSSPESLYSKLSEQIESASEMASPPDFQAQNIANSAYLSNFSAPPAVQHGDGENGSARAVNYPAGQEISRPVGEVDQYKNLAEAISGVTEGSVESGAPPLGDIANGAYPEAQTVAESAPPTIPYPPASEVPFTAILGERPVHENGYTDATWNNPIDEAPLAPTEPPAPFETRAAGPVIPEELPQQAAPERTVDAGLASGYEQAAVPAESFSSPEVTPSAGIPSSAVSGGDSLRRPVGFQEPKAVMNEMASLMAKLEQQVSKAAKRLAGRAEEIEQRLNRKVDALLEEASQEDKDIEASILVVCDGLGKDFEHVSESLRQKISELANDGRQHVKQLSSLCQSDVDKKHESIRQGIEDACLEFRTNNEALIEETKARLKKLIDSGLSEMEGLLKTMLEHHKSVGRDFESGMKDRFERFRERMTDETSVVLSGIERNVRSLGEEIDGSWERASEKLRLTQSEHEKAIKHAVRRAELTTSQSARMLLVEQFLPKLKERKEIIATMVAEMTTSFSEQSLTQARGQLLGLESSLTSARQQLQSLADECLGKIDSVGRDQQSVLEELFKETSGYIEHSTSEVLTQLKNTEEVILEGEAICKKLAETFSLDADPGLTEERNNAIGKVTALRGQLRSQMEGALDTNSTRLDITSQTAQVELNKKRLEHTKAVRDASESGLNRIREAIQEAFNAVQTAREKHME